MKIAIMSFAHLHAVSYVRCLQALGVELTASDPDHVDRPAGEAGGPALAAELGVPYVDSYAELLEGKPDGVVVCSENAKHRELVELAAAAGAHVLCEKPIATTLADARAMIDACAASNVNLMIAYPVRFSPAFAALKGSLESGALGTPVAVTGTNNGQIPLDQRAWFVDPELAGGGSLTDHTVHVADLLDSLFDSARASSVYATTNKIMHAGKVEVETGGLVSIRYDNGVSATIDCSWSKPPSYPTWGGLTLQLVGTRGIADMDAFSQRVDGHSESTGNGVWLSYGPNSDAVLVAEFVSSIAEGRAPQPDGEVGYRTLQIVAAGYESVRTGQPVSLAPIRSET
jgi:1,5-anhydro-D-fructose reductase (1,5-anhydro-D-mannitol-forming)